MANKMQQTYIIEHLEPKLFKWCIYEYEHISQIVGKANLLFTNIKTKADKIKLQRYGKVLSKRVCELKLDIRKSCILDPESSKLLNPKEAKKFNYFIFGGILGDYPPRKRTKTELTCFIKEAITRNIGKKQMSTDNAVYTVHEIAKGKKLENLKFKNKISITINNIESIELPYLYNLVNNKPFISPKVVDYLKNKKGF